MSENYGWPKIQYVVVTFKVYFDIIIWYYKKLLLSNVVKFGF